MKAGPASSLLSRDARVLVGLVTILVVTVTVPL
jgi:hypothetical protein